MFKTLKSRRRNNAQRDNAQVAAEYALLVAVAIMALAAMTTFIKRTIQARIRDTHVFVFNQIGEAHRAMNAVGNFVSQYEPYYAITGQLVDSRKDEKTELSDKGGATGVSRKIFKDITIVETKSESLPPREAD